MWSRKLIIMYSNNRSRRIFGRSESVCSGGVRALEDRRERIVVQASLSHSVIARESNVVDFVWIPARWDIDLSMVRIDWRIRSIEAWNSDFKTWGESFS